MSNCNMPCISLRRALAWLCLCALPAVAVAAAPEATPACIDVEVNGQRVPDYACISQRLAPAPVSPVRAAGPLGSEQRVRQAPSALGLAHRAATQQRMGNSFGVSTQPQRPTPAPAPPPLPAPARP